MILDVWRALKEAVQAQGGTTDDLMRIATQEGLAEQIAKVVMTFKTNEVEIFTVTVDYQKPMARLVKEGHYYSVSPEIIQDNFRNEGEKEKTEIAFRVIQMEKLTNPKEAEKRLDRSGLRTATIKELLAFGAKFPDVQRQFHIGALGSIGISSRGYKCIAYLACMKGKKERVMRHADYGSGVRHSISHFLAAPKE